MQSAPLLPRTAPFAEEQIAALNSVISVTTAEQRAWLSGYLAGLQAANDPQAAVAAVPPAKRVPLTILFGTSPATRRRWPLRPAKPPPNWDSRRKWSIWRTSRSRRPPPRKTC